MPFIKVPPRASGLGGIRPDEVVLTAYHIKSSRGGGFICRLSIGVSAAYPLKLNGRYRAEVLFGIKEHLGTAAIRFIKAENAGHDTKSVRIAKNGVITIAMTPLPDNANLIKRSREKLKAEATPARIETDKKKNEINIPATLVIELPDDFYTGS